MPLDSQSETQMLAMLEKLRLVADEQIAQRIIETQKLAWTTARVDLYKEEEKHLCSKLGCLRPVTGALIFQHCNEHLDMFEEEWFKGGIEAEIQAAIVPGEDAIDVLNRWCQSGQHQLKTPPKFGSAWMMKRNRETSERLLAEAKAYIADCDRSDRERWAFLPMTFHGNLRRAWKAQLKSVGIRSGEDE
jgi:hypothetical protein